MYKFIFIATMLLLLVACKNNNTNNAGENKALAERFMREEYGINPSVVDELAAENIVVSYPAFKKLFGTFNIRGREAVRNFSEGFSHRWKDTQLTIQESIAEGNSVAFVWSFKGRMVGSPSPDIQPTNKMESWGGITIYRFNKQGKIEKEYGLESVPGFIEQI